jgi:hypothetical protein
MHQILVAISQKFLLQKRGMGYEKRRKEKERVEKMDTKASKILKTMGTQMPTSLK